jgi:hypothetical protein
LIEQQWLQAQNKQEFQKFRIFKATAMVKQEEPFSHAGPANQPLMPPAGEKIQPAAGVFIQKICILLFYAAAMKLKMFIEETFIDELPVSFDKITLPGYLEALKETLEEKHFLLINSTPKKPYFFVDNVPSLANTLINA